MAWMSMLSDDSAVRKTIGVRLPAAAASRISWSPSLSPRR
jgi:hypothetical protein